MTSLDKRKLDLNHDADCAVWDHLSCNCALLRPAKWNPMVGNGHVVETPKPRPFNYAGVPASRPLKRAK